ncbi:hypothetical protein ABPG75_000711 [Micractinium tetrahymenae]
MFILLRPRSESFHLRVEPAPAGRDARWPFPLLRCHLHTLSEDCFQVQSAACNTLDTLAALRLRAKAEFEASLRGASARFTAAAQRRRRGSGCASRLGSCSDRRSQNTGFLPAPSPFVHTTRNDRCSPPRPAVSRTAAESSEQATRAVWTACEAGLHEAAGQRAPAAVAAAGTMSGAGGGPGLEAGRRLLQWLEANRRKLVLSIGGVYVLTAGVVALKALSGEQAVEVPEEENGPEPTRQELDDALQWQERQAREQMRREARWEQEERQERNARRDEQQEGLRR